MTFENSDNTFQKPVGALYSIAEATPHSSKSDTLIIPGTPRHGRQLADKEMSLIEENLLLQSKSSFRDISPMQSESIKRAESCDDTQDNVSMVATRSIKEKHRVKFWILFHIKIIRMWKFLQLSFSPNPMHPVVNPKRMLILRMTRKF